MASGDDLGTIRCNAFEGRVGASGELVSRGTGDHLYRLPQSPDAGTHGFWYLYTVPENYDGGGFDFTVRYAMATATANDIATRLQVANVTGDDLDTAPDFGTATQVDDTVPATAGVPGSFVAAVSHANAGSPSPGDLLLVELVRLGDDGDDDATGGCQWIDIRVSET